ncbi:hypothetical protein BHE74_00026509 [Ensete ventricosum]|nr:hypothetical protein BHE74_00026509 [Ensete ventricosum]
MCTIRYGTYQGSPYRSVLAYRDLAGTVRGIGRYGKPWEVRIGLRGYQYADFLLPDDANVLTDTEAY